jgi:hypothetical protein
VIHSNMYEVRVTKKTAKRIAKAPETVQILFDELATELRNSGTKDSVVIEVYYAGSREDAPY